MILEKKENAMLHFIYNSKAIAVLVNHSYENGEFVVQVPIFPETQPLESFNKEICINIINNLIDKDHQLKPDELVEIKNFGFWNLSGVIADSYHKNNVVLCGDAAHSFPPAGGFGMNTGVQDAYNLAYKLAYMVKNNVSLEDQEKILDQYSEERKSHAHFNLSIAMKYYQNSLNIANYLGLKKENLDIFKTSLSFVGKIMPKSAVSNIFQLGKTLGSYHLESGNPMLYRDKVGVHPDYRIPLIFMDKETTWKYNYNNYQDKLRGMLCPHIYLKDQNGNSLSLRNLCDHIFQNNLSDKSETFFLAVNLTSQPLDSKKISEIINTEPIKAKVVQVNISTETQKNTTSDSKSALNFTTESLSPLFEKLGVKSANGLILRSDSTLISIL